MNEQQALAEAIKKVATGPHLSKDLSVDDAFQATKAILSGDADDVRAAIFFIAMRMKRETNDENLGIYQALQAYTEQHIVDIDDVLIFADPYNGFNRHCPVAVFLPAVLAASGLPCLSQGVYEMGPKFGVTHAQVLEKAGRNIQQTVAQAAASIADADIGWAYLDQAQASPALYALQDLRTRMIKRPSLATLEKLLMPVKAARTHLAIGFVHKAYPPQLAWLADKVGFDSALIVRGLEGGIIPTLREASNNYRMINGEMIAATLAPEDFAIESDTRGVMAEQETVSAAETLQRGLAALSGEQGPAYDSLVYGAAMALWHTGKQPDYAAAAEHVRSVIDSGKAKRHFERGIA